MKPDNAIEKAFSPEAEATAQADKKKADRISKVLRSQWTK
jgi:hypothetical protein